MPATERKRLRAAARAETEKPFRLRRKVKSGNEKRSDTSSNSVRGIPVP